MKKLLLSLSLFGATNLFAQQYKIVVHYDANGNRIIRERVAQTAGRPESNEPLASDTLGQQNRLFAFNLLQDKVAEILVFPNPTAGNFTVELSSPSMFSQPCTMMITDALGRQVLRAQITELEPAMT